MTVLKIIVLGCAPAAVAITLKVRLDTPQGPQPLVIKSYADALGIIVSRMHKYRLYVYDAGDRLIAPPMVISADNDESARSLNTFRGFIISRRMVPRRFPRPWTIEDIGAAFVVRDRRGEALAYEP